VGRRAVYIGSFDPVTNGHLSVIDTALRVFDELYVAVACNIEKKPIFTADERVSLIKKAVGSKKNVHIGSFDGLAVDYAKNNKASVLIRSLRAVSDFEQEFQMALANRRLAKTIETVFLMPSEDYFFISSRLIKEIVKLGGSVKDFVPPHVEDVLRKKLL